MWTPLLEAMVCGNRGSGVKGSQGGRALPPKHALGKGFCNGASSLPAMLNKQLTKITLLTCTGGRIMRRING